MDTSAINSSTALSTSEILALVNQYIGVDGGYLGDFNQRTHADFYREYCNLTIDPNKYKGTTRERFIAIISTVPPQDQAAIIRGIINKFPIGKGPTTRTTEMLTTLRRVVQRLESGTPTITGCAGRTKSGKPCQAKAGSSGFCSVHDPAIIERQRLQREAQEVARKEAEILRRPLLDIISRIEDICRVRGWRTQTRYFDEETAKHAVVAAYRQVILLSESATLIEIEIDEHNETAIKFRRDPLYHDEGTEDLHLAIRKGFNLPIEHPKPPTTFKSRQSVALVELENLLHRFHRVAAFFAKPDKYGNILPIQIEADVQHMLYGLLMSRFDDIRPEDFGPYRAGARSRVDFLLEDEKIIIETKMTRTSMNDKEVAEQLIIDIERYQAVPECQILVCFVYDPEGFIENPLALKKDLEKPKREIKVKVIIYKP